MKIYVVSDIHGSYYYAKEFIDKFLAGQGDQIIILGDILYHGPRNPLPRDYNPQKVYELLNLYADKIIWCKGNCDSEVDEMVLDFPSFDAYSFKFAHHSFYCCHGHKDNYPSNQIILRGHFHVPNIEIKKNHIIANPGSIALPKDNCPPSYMILNDDKMTIVDLSDNVLLEKDI